jgi:hypothetical protein
VAGLAGSITSKGSDVSFFFILFFHFGFLDLICFASVFFSFVLFA